MKIQILQIKVNEGRREASPEAIQELADSISKIGLLNPITVDKDYTLIAGLHRLEAAKLLGWKEIECNVNDLEGLMAELAEVDENFVRKGLSKVEYGELLLRRKEIYESLHPETRRGMRNGQTSKTADSAVLETKSFIEDTAEKTGKSPRTIAAEVQMAKNLTPEAKEIIQKADAKINKTDVLKLSRLAPEQQADTASQLAAGQIHSMKEYLSTPEPPESSEHLREPSEPCKDHKPETRRFLTFEENVADLKDPNKDCSCTPDTFVAEFCAYVQNFIRGIKWYITPDYSIVFPALSQEQICCLRELAVSLNDTVDTIFHQIEEGIKKEVEK